MFFNIVSGKIVMRNKVFFLNFYNKYNQLKDIFMYYFHVMYTVGFKSLYAQTTLFQMFEYISLLRHI